MTNQGQQYFAHEESCMFSRGEYGSENEESEGDADYGQEFSGDGAGGPNEEVDIEGDREVDMLRRRLERIDQMHLKHKMRPNISQEWVSKLREKLRILSGQNSASPPVPA